MREALKHAALYYGVDADIEWISSTDLETVEDAEAALKDVDAVIVPGGFGSRGVEGKIRAARFAREHNLPYLGLCLGLQVMVIDYARNVLGLKDANSAEFDKMTEHPVIDLMTDQKGLDRLGGTMRLGLYPAVFLKTRWRAIYTIRNLWTNATAIAMKLTTSIEKYWKNMVWFFLVNRRWYASRNSGK